MTEALALGIDLGTSGVRVVATNAQHDVIAFATTPLPAPLRAGHHVTQNAEVWWQAVCTVLDELRLKISMSSVVAISVDGTSGSIVPIDIDGRPLAPASMYNDRSDRQVAESIARIAPPETAAHGMTSPLGRALAFQNIKNIARILHQADWIISHFTGRFDTSDENNALKTGYNPITRAWPDWIERAGFDLKLLPNVVPVGSVTGLVCTGMQQRFGFSNSARVVAGTTDGCAAFLASGASKIGDGVTSLGTTLVIKLLSEAPIFASQCGIYSHRIGDLWLAGGASNSGGAALLKFFDADQMAALEPLMRVDHPIGLDFYPLQGTGERFPVYDPQLKSRVSPRPADDAQFLQALLEGVGHVEALAYQRMAELGGPALNRVFTVGGGAKNTAWGEIRSRILKLPLHHPASEDAAAGTARLAWKGFYAT